MYNPFVARCAIRSEIVLPSSDVDALPSYLANADDQSHTREVAKMQQISRMK